MVDHENMSQDDRGSTDESSERGLGDGASQGAGASMATGRLRPMQWLATRVWRATCVIVCILVFTTLMGLFARWNWLADLLTNLRVQQVIMLLVTISITIALKRRRWLVVQMILLLIHLPWFLSAWTGAATVLPSDSPELVVMVANVLTANRNHDAVLNDIKASDADVVAILELGTPLHKRLEDELATIYPHRVTNPQDRGNFGIGVYSRYPLSNTNQFALNIESIKSIEATVKKGSQSYRLIATHPLPPMGRRGYANRNGHLQQLAQRVVAYRETNPKQPMIVVGDFNLTPWSPIFSDWESSTGLTRAGRGFGMTPTWYALTEKQQAFFPMGLILDHALISDNLKCLSQKIGDATGSDHRSVRVELAANEAGE